MCSFLKTMEDQGVTLQARCVTTLQVNITRLCNQTCAHCHVAASPTRQEMMDTVTIDRCLEVLAEHDRISTLDITGGAPELHPDFTYLVEQARALGRQVIVRHNLTVTLDPHPLTGASMRWLPRFFAEQGVNVFSSLPHYQPYLTDRQRGDGVFLRSIESMRLLNEQGYGAEKTGLVLNLVHNPVGPYLPADQTALERDYRRALEQHHGVRFNNLFCLTNMPVRRFADQLRALDAQDSYMARLKDACNPAAAANVMCRDMVSVGLDGTLYDCDFNQVLRMPVGGSDARTIFSFDADALATRTIRVGDHCFGCTAGAGSSCGGATA